MTRILGTVTGTACTLRTGEAGTAIGDIHGTAATAGTHQAGTGDGTGTTTGDGTLGMQIHFGDGMIRSMIHGGALHTGRATGLYTDLEYIRDIILDIILQPAPEQNQTMDGKFTTERGTATLHTTITRAMLQTAAQTAGQIQEVLHANRQMLHS